MSSQKAGEAADVSDREIVITREFDAPRELVFNAWINPTQLARWWGPKGFTNPVCRADARPGGQIYIVMRAPNGVDYPMGGEFHEIVPFERLVFTTRALDENGNLMFEFLHWLTLLERDGKSALTIRSRIINTTAGAERYTNGFEAGMTQSLERLAGLLAEDQPLVIERILNAPVERVWRALTRNAELKRWYFDLPDFKAEVGFEFEFAAKKDGVTYVHLCRITEVIPQKKIAYTWRYQNHSGDSLVSFELFADGQKTLVRVTHKGLETFPRIPDFAAKNFAAGWTYILGTGLRTFVEHAADTSDREIVITRLLDAPRELVFDAFADPRRIVKWWGPNGFSTTIEVMDLRVGGAWKLVMHGPDGTDYPNSSIFTEVVRPERIAYEHEGAKEGGADARSSVTVAFEEVGDQTRLTLRMIYPSTEARDLVVKEYGAIEGGNQTLGRLAELLEKQPVFSVTREFDAPRELVWRAWTESDRLARWWGPRGFEMLSCRVDLRPGGICHYGMRASNGMEMWGKFVYRVVTKPDCLVFINSFSDKDGGTQRHFASATWPLEVLNIMTLTEHDGRTTLTLKGAPINATEEERRTFEAGFDSMRTGFGGALDQLGEYLAKR